MYEKYKNSQREDMILSHFSTKAMDCDDGHGYHIKPKRYFTLIYVVEGKMTFSFNQSAHLDAKENDFVFIPENRAYTVDCIGAPRCKFVTTDMSIWGYCNDKRETFGEKPAIIFEDTEKEFVGGFCEYISVYNENSDFSWLYRHSIMEKLLYRMLLKAFNVKKERENSKVDKALRYIQEHYTEEFDVEELAKMCALNMTTFRKSFHKATNTTPLKYKNTLRIEEAMRLLSTTDMSVSEVALQVGMNDTKYFTDFFKRITGISPSEYVKKMK